jgi:hypothetical protein
VRCGKSAAGRSAHEQLFFISLLLLHILYRLVFYLSSDVMHECFITFSCNTRIAHSRAGTPLALAFCFPFEVPVPFPIPFPIHIHLSRSRLDIAAPPSFPSFFIRVRSPSLTTFFALYS